MYLRAGVFSLSLLVISRLLGLLRESAQAAAFGASSMGDVVIVMFTLPDLLVGVLVSGALSYVLLPAWAGQGSNRLAAVQKKLAMALLALGLILGALVWLARHAVVQLLAPGLSPQMAALSAASLGWSAAALPLAMLAALWVTRLQHERDFVGMYAGNLVVNGVLVLGLLVFAQYGADVDGVSVLELLGASLLFAMLARLGWLAWRLPATRQPPLKKNLAASTGQSGTLPLASVWVWAALSSALVLLLPLVARSIVSQSGEGALASFNYAWKLVELPLVLAIQLVASLAFPALAATAPQSAQRLKAMQVAFALAWTLACAAVAVVATFSKPLASLLFGWGSMTPADIDVIAQWSAIGVWSLLPQALLAVLLTMMAITARMRWAAGVYALGFAALLAFGWLGATSVQGAGVMWVLNGVLAAIAVALLVSERQTLSGAMPLAAFASPLAACVLLVLLKPHLIGHWPNLGLPATGMLACGYALAVLGIGVAASPALRRLVLLKSARRPDTDDANDANSA